VGPIVRGIEPELALEEIFALKAENLKSNARMDVVTQVIF
jgi:hypothetical protein